MAESTALATTSTWDISTDIYKTVETVEDLKKRYVEDEDETTLALGIYGFISDLESKKIQTAVIMTGELGNEMFPSRAKLDKNVLTHAIYENVTEINAVPASIVVNIGIKTQDLEKYMESNRFTFDRTNPIYIGNYEFHFDYDVILQKNQTASMAAPVYSARYDMSVKNSISDVSNPYLKQPYTIYYANFEYVVFQATIRQVTIEWTSDRLVTNSIIDNKTFIFEFSNQLADFVVDVTDNGKTTRLTPVFYGAPIDADVEYYCWYLYLNDHTVRIMFDSVSFIPGLNAEVTIEAQTTLGSEGNIRYDHEQPTFVEFESATYGYNKINCYLAVETDAYNGTDRKSTEELKEVIPKYALSRGYLTTETDLDNYFNLINTSTNRLKLQKKVDNQLERIWYCYFLIKDEFSNIIPTNTVDIQLNVNDGSCFQSEDGRMVLPAGTYMKFDPETRLATVMDEADVPPLYSDEFFNDEEYYYVSVFNIAICTDPLYAAFYMTTVNHDSYFAYEWANDNCDLQFVTNRNNITRKLLTDRNVYTFTFSMEQSVKDDFDMYYEIDNGDGTTTIVNKMKCVLVIYKGNEPYRWVEARCTGYDYDTWTSYWEIDMETDNGLDTENNIKLLNLGVAGSTSTNYGYFETSPKAYLYIMANFGEEYGRYDLDSIAPGYDGYSVTNVYEVEDGLVLFRNYTSMMNTKITALNDNEYTLTGFPMVGAHYMMSEDYVQYFMNALDTKRTYIEDCLKLVENSMDIDLKFFNTYGPSVTYCIGDEQETMINHIDLEMNFRIKLIYASDVYTKDQVVQDIKEYVENINDIGDLNLSNLVTQLENEYEGTLEFVEFMNFNRFWLGVQHIVLLDVEDPHVVPEFLCIRNKYNEETDSLEPCIGIEVLS